MRVGRRRVRKAPGASARKGRGWALAQAYRQSAVRGKLKWTGGRAALPLAVRLGYPDGFCTSEARAGGGPARARRDKNGACGTCAPRGTINVTPCRALGPPGGIVCYLLPSCLSR